MVEKKKKKNSLCFWMSFFFLEDQWNWVSIDETVQLPDIPKKDDEKLYKQYDLCLTGEVSSI